MVVVAVGCRLMKDDAIGVLVAEHIRENLNDHGINVVIAETDLGYGMAVLESDDRVIILDAFTSGKKPGSITILSLQEIEADETRPLSQHEHKLTDFIKRPYTAKGCLVGIEAADLNYGLELSVQLRLLFNDICNSVKHIILHEHGSP